MEHIWIDGKRMGGKPCIIHTRFPVATLLAELATGHALQEVVDDYDLDGDHARGAIEDVAIMLDRRWTENKMPATVLEYLNDPHWFDS